MTACSTIAGMLPVAIGLGGGAYTSARVQAIQNRLTTGGGERGKKTTYQVTPPSPGAPAWPADEALDPRPTYNVE